MASANDRTVSSDSQGSNNKFQIDPEEERQYHEPSRIWYAATVFPLTSACFGPVGLAFSITALVQGWRVTIPSSGSASDEVYIQDPTWLTVVKAVSLAVAVISNLTLLLSMAHRLPYAIAQTATIIGWYIASIMLLVVICLTHALQSSSDYSLAQPFYYGCSACGIYFLISTLLLITTWGAYYKKLYDADFSSTLTLPQRTLMAQSMLFIIYALCGAAVFSHIEGWFFVNGVYWVTITLLTIGYGDIVPVTHLGRSLMVPFAMAGIVMLGLVIGSIGSLVLDRAAKKMGARMTELERQRLESELDNPQSSEEGHGTDTAEYKAIPREKREFNMMRRVQSRAQTRQRWTLTSIATFAIAVLWLIGAVIFWQTESSPISMQSSQWSYFESIYFMFISLVTIGYGDFSVVSNAGRPIFVFWILLAVPTMTILIASMGATVLIVIKGIIAKIDAFIVLPHESNTTDSFASKAKHMGKLKLKAKAKRGEEGVETHGEGTRNTDTGRVMNVHHHVHDLPTNMHTGDSAGLTEDDHAERLRLGYLIGKEIRMLIDHMDDSPEKQYSFEEWTRFLHLLGIRAAKDEEGNTALTHHDNREKMRPKGSEIWSWLGNDSPLFSNKSETLWLLERLSQRLEDILEDHK